jgi:hypothetical protein
MFRSLIISLFCCFCCTLSFSQAAGTWAGHSEYMVGDTSGPGAQKLKLHRSFIMQIHPNGIVNGTARRYFDKSQNFNRLDLQDHFAGHFDTVTKKMALAIQIPKPQGLTSYPKTDSLHYSYTVTQVGDSLVITLQRDDDKNRVDFNYYPATKSWIISMLPARMQMSYINRVPVPAIADTDTVQVPARDKDIQHTIFLDTPFIRIDLYDNGEIDNDIITLLLDGKTVVRSQLLASRPFSLPLELSKEPTEHLLEMFADNLGSIPPNTALLVLTCKHKRYELNLSSNGKVNGSVKLVVRP